MKKYVKRGRAFSGYCLACGQAAVQIREDGEAVRTYHPAIIVQTSRSKPCIALLPIPGTTIKSFDLHHNMFRPIKGESEE